MLLKRLNFMTVFRDTVFSLQLILCRTPALFELFGLNNIVFNNFLYNVSKHTQIFTKSRRKRVIKPFNKNLHNMILFNSFNIFSIKPTLIQYPLYMLYYFRENARGKKRIVSC
jgi:hypothetical protein